MVLDCVESSTVNYESSCRFLRPTTKLPQRWGRHDIELDPITYESCSYPVPAFLRRVQADTLAVDHFGTDHRTVNPYIVEMSDAQQKSIGCSNDRDLADMPRQFFTR